MSGGRIASVLVLLVGVGTFPATVRGQAVQLPSYSVFGTRTTVSVPDRGSVYLGGVNRARSGRNEFGAPLLPFGNRSIGLDRSATSARVSVYIHDFQAMDEYLLSRPTRAFPGGYAARGSLVDTRRPAALPTRARALAADTWQSRADRFQRATAGPAAMGVAELRAKHQRDAVARQAEAEQFFQRGKHAEAAGKPGVAKIYYRQAARRAQGELKQRILAQLDPLSNFAVARSTP